MARTTRNDSAAAPSLGGKSVIVLFVFTLFAFVAESQLTQYVQTTLQYRHPFFIFYVVHSSFAIIFPLHLLYLTATTKYSTAALMKGLSAAVTNHLSPAPRSPDTVTTFPLLRFLRLVALMTVGVTLPGLLWFASISLASITDVTVIWNTNAFFAYIISVKVFHLKWEPRRLGAVLLATLGVMVVVYGGSTSESDAVEKPVEAIDASTVALYKPSAPLVGDVLTLIASVGYAFYQVLYKKYAALPNDPELAAEEYEQLPESDGAADPEYDSVLSGLDIEDAVYPTPFALHPNMLTSIIGICTLCVLWIPIPILHYLGIETFAFPSNLTTVFAIAGICLGGVIFNAGFMILLGVWGPIITSVGGLLTIVLVFISDLFIGNAADVLNLWSIVGSGAIVVAFGVLAYDMFNRR